MSIDSWTVLSLLHGAMGIVVTSRLIYHSGAGGVQWAKQWFSGCSLRAEIIIISAPECTATN